MREKGLDRLAPYGHAKVEKILDSAAKERLISLGVNEDFSLRVRLPDGSTEDVRSGEVTLRVRNSEFGIRN